MFECEGVEDTPGLVPPVIARAHGIHPQLLYTWRRQAKAGKLALPASEMPDFAPLVLEEDAPPPMPEVPSCSTDIGVEVGGVMVRLPDDADAVRVAAIAVALREAL